MAHELDFVNGEAAHAYVGEVGWHGFGQKLEKGASLDEWAKAAHMDWEIFRTAVKYDVVTDSVDNPVETKLFADKHVLYRSDSNGPLSVVSPSYKIVQPYEVLEFYKDLVGVAGMELETAGVLFGGRRFWAMANTGRLAELKGGDMVKGYLLLSSSCDGTLATSAQFTSIRVVCNNTCKIALNDENHKIRVPHNRTWNPSEVKEQLGLIDSGWNKFLADITKLSNSFVTRDKAAEYLVKLFGDIEVPVEEQSPAVAAKCAGIWELFSGAGKGATLPSSEGTAWGILNAVTESIDHHTGHRTIDARVASAWYGSGDRLKTSAFELALQTLT